MTPWDTASCPAPRARPTGHPGVGVPAGRSSSWPAEGRTAGTPGAVYRCPRTPYPGIGTRFSLVDRPGERSNAEVVEPADEVAGVAATEYRSARSCSLSSCPGGTGGRARCGRRRTSTCSHVVLVARGPEVEHAEASVGHGRAQVVAVRAVRHAEVVGRVRGRHGSRQRGVDRGRWGTLRCAQTPGSRGELAWPWPSPPPSAAREQSAT